MKHVLFDVDGVLIHPWRFRQHLIDHYGITPDIMTLAKGLTCGYVPLGAVIVRDHIARHFDENPLVCGLTYSGHPVGCAAALATMEVYEEENLIERGRVMGERMAEHLAAMKEKHPCVGDVRSVGLFKKVGLLTDPIHASFVMGVASGMPARAEWLPLLIDELPDGAHFQTIVIGREEVWEVHRRSAQLGGDVRTGLEDTFYLPDGTRAESNGTLVEALVDIVRAEGREPATAAQTRAAYGLA